MAFYIDLERDLRANSAILREGTQLMKIKMKLGATLADSRRIRSGLTGTYYDATIVVLKRWIEACGMKSAHETLRLALKATCLQSQRDKFELPANTEVLEQCNDTILLKTPMSSLYSSSIDSSDGSVVLPSTHMPPDHDQSSYSHQHYEKNFIQKESIGEGGFGKVYKVQHKLDKEHYAMKKIKVTKRKSCSLQREQREIKILACLNHPNVLRYHHSWYGEEFPLISQPSPMALGSNEEQEEGEEQEGINRTLGSTSSMIIEFVETRSQRHSQQTSMTISMDQADDHRCCYLYIQTELCQSTLRTWLDDRNDKISKTKNQFDVVNEEENQNIFKQTLEGMNYIHSQGIIHRDVTPRNIFLIDKNDGHPLVKMGDFGLARPARECVPTEPNTPMRFKWDQDLDNPDVSQTRTSGIGTKIYASPERLNGTTYDNKADMFSLGLILFELYHPFGTGMERHKCLEKLREEDIPEELQKRWPVQYSAIQCLTRQDSQERPSASDLLSGEMFPSENKNIEILEEENKKLITQRDQTADI